MNTRSDQSIAFAKFVKQVQYTREVQRRFFQCSKNHDETNKQKYLRLSVELERKLDQRCVELIELLQNGFQPELFT